MIMYDHKYNYKNITVYVFEGRDKWYGHINGLRRWPDLRAETRSELEAKYRDVIDEFYDKQES